MNPTFAIILSLAVIALFALMWRSLLQREQEDTVMRHTIGVNLRILQAELLKLSAFQPVDVSPEALAEAAEQLRLATAGAEDTFKRLRDAGHDDLQGILTDVFAAMDHSTTARRLLKACKPF